MFCLVWCIIDSNHKLPMNIDSCHWWRHQRWALELYKIQRYPSNNSRAPLLRALDSIRCPSCPAPSSSHSSRPGALDLWRRWSASQNWWASCSFSSSFSAASSSWALCLFSWEMLTEFLLFLVAPGVDSMIHFEYCSPWVYLLYGGIRFCCLQVNDIRYFSLLSLWWRFCSSTDSACCMCTGCCGQSIIHWSLLWTHRWIGVETGRSDSFRWYICSERIWCLHLCAAISVAQSRGWKHQGKVFAYHIDTDFLASVDLWCWKSLSTSWQNSLSPWNKTTVYVRLCWCHSTKWGYIRSPTFTVQSLDSLIRIQNQKIMSYCPWFDNTAKSYLIYYCYHLLRLWFIAVDSFRFILWFWENSCPPSWHCCLSSSVSVFGRSGSPNWFCNFQSQDHQLEEKTWDIPFRNGSKPHLSYFWWRSLSDWPVCWQDIPLRPKACSKTADLGQAGLLLDWDLDWIDDTSWNTCSNRSLCRNHVLLLFMACKSLQAGWNYSSSSSRWTSAADWPCHVSTSQLSFRLLTDLRGYWKRLLFQGHLYSSMPNQCRCLNRLRLTCSIRILNQSKKVFLRCDYRRGEHPDLVSVNYFDWLSVASGVILVSTPSSYCLVEWVGSLISEELMNFLARWCFYYFHSSNSLWPADLHYRRSSLIQLQIARESWSCSLGSSESLPPLRHQLPT